MRFGIFLLCIGVAVVTIIYTKWLVDSVGRIQYFEEKLGNGGTYNFWKLFGLAVIIFGFYYLFT